MTEIITTTVKLIVINRWLEEDGLALRNALAMEAAEAEEDAGIDEWHSIYFSGCKGYKDSIDEDLREEICEYTENFDEEYWLGYIDQMETEMKRFKTNG